MNHKTKLDQLKREYKRACNDQLKAEKAVEQAKIKAEKARARAIKWQVRLERATITAMADDDFGIREGGLAGRGSM